MGPQKIQPPEITPPLVPGTVPGAELMNKVQSGRLSNMLTTGAGGAQLGAMFGGLPGGIIGGAAGAGVGALLPPSQTPGTDIGATAAEMLASRFLPGSGKLLSKVLRIGGVSTATAGGAYIGSIGDRKADFISETPWGKIAFYGGAGAGALGLQALTAPGPSATMLATGRVAKATGEDIPLTPFEATGKGASLEKFFLHGTEAEVKLGKEQSAIGERAFNKIMGRSVEDAQRVVEQGLQSQVAGTRVYKGIEKEVKSFNESLGEQIAEAKKAGDSVVSLEKQFKDPTTELSTRFGLDTNEARYFMKYLRSEPERFIEQFMPSGGKENLKGLFAIRGLSKVLSDEEFARLGNALVMRVLAKNGGFTSSATGVTMNGQSFTKALFKNFGRERIELALGSARTEALEDLATVMEIADPMRKILAGQSITETQRTVSYLMHKLAFAITSGSAAGHAAAGLGGALVGGVVGALAVIPLSTAISHILANPAASKLLLAAAKGDATAATKFIRSLTSLQSDKNEQEPLAGLLQRAKK